MMDYSLCDQTVTIYRRDTSGIVRQVVNGCFYTYQDVEKEDETGVYQKRQCLLIVPAEKGSVQIGDKVLPGVGQQISLSNWGSFIPVMVDGLSEINYVTPCCWEGQLSHIEAGRK